MTQKTKIASVVAVIIVLMGLSYWISQPPTTLQSQLLSGGSSGGGAGQVLTNVCGNFWVEAGEQCDDGNLLNFDGCNSHCQIEAPDAGAFTSAAQSDQADREREARRLEELDRRKQELEQRKEEARSQPVVIPAPSIAVDQLGGEESASVTLKGAAPLPVTAVVTEQQFEPDLHGAAPQAVATPRNLSRSGPEESFLLALLLAALLSMAIKMPKEVL